MLRKQLFAPSRFLLAPVRYYTKTHEWLDLDEGAKTASLGLTDYSIKELNNLTFIDLPSPPASFAAGDDICSIESVKAVGHLKTPFAGKLASVNTEWEDSANLVRFNDGNAEKAENWIARLDNIEVTAEGKAELMNKAQFDAFVDAEAK